VWLGGGFIAYNFTTAASQAYGEGQSYLGNGVYGMTSGDANSDGIVDLSDIIQTWMPQAGSAGYFSGDADLNGQVSNQDKNDSWWPNLGKECQVPQ
jgi:hypothetical protein